MQRRSIFGGRKSKAFTKDVRLQAKEESKTPVDIETQVKQLVQQHGRLHAKTLTFMNHQALAYRDMDKNEDALQVYREVHDGCKQTLGMQHPYTLASIPIWRTYSSKWTDFKRQGLC